MKKLTLLGAVLALWSLLAVFKAPAKPFFYLALVATEQGHILALLTLALFLLTREKYLLIAAILFFSPVLRAEKFGSINWLTLYRGASVPHMDPDTVVYRQISGKPLRMDVYYQNNGTRRPGILVIHGGSWAGGDRTEFSNFNRYFAARGFVVAAIDYRLAPEWHYPKPVDDVRTALSYMKDHAADWGLDPKKIVLMGRSAGGQVALSAAYDNPDPAIRGVIAMYAPNDLKLAYTIPGNPLIINSRKVISDYLGGSLSDIPALYEAASPLYQVGPTSPPTLLVHGGRDEFVWRLHSDRLAARLKAAGRPYRFLLLPWATHGADYFLGGPSGQLILREVEQFLKMNT